MNVPDFRTAFRTEATVATESYGDLRLTRQKIGTLCVTTGAIVACDPLVFPERKPFTRRIPPGRYPVFISVAHVRAKGESKRSKADQRIACAWLRLGTRVPARWEMATVPGQKLRELEPGQYFGYPVDAGVGCFMDHAAAKVLCRLGPGKVSDRMIDAARLNYVHTRDWADFPLDEKTGLNVVFCSSGWGDGSYASYWGFDRGGEVVCLATDFQVLPRTVDAATGRPADADDA